MPAMLELGKGTISTTSAAIIAAVAAGQHWEVRVIHIRQPSTAGAKTVAFGRGTLTTITDTDGVISRVIPAGEYSETIHTGGIGLTAAATFDAIASAGNNEMTYLLEGYKTFVA